MIDKPEDTKQKLAPALAHSSTQQQIDKKDQRLAYIRQVARDNPELTVQLMQAWLREEK